MVSGSSQVPLSVKEVPKSLFPIDKFYTDLFGNLGTKSGQGFTLQGVQKKPPICVQRLIEVLKSDLQIKVGWVLTNSGNPLLNGHWNFPFLLVGAEQFTFKDFNLNF